MRIIDEIKKNCQQSKTEHIFWAVISVIVAVFGVALGLNKLLAISTGIVLYVGTMALNVRKETVVMTATLLYIIGTFSLNSKNFEMLKTSFEIDYRPLVIAHMDDPIKLTKGGAVFLGKPVIIRNTGKIPATNIETSYYLTTDVDKSNIQESKWFDEYLGGFGTVRFLPPAYDETEYGYRSMNNDAKYYYFEALTTYEGNEDTEYWTHVIRVFHVEGEDGVLSPVYRYGEWDRNKDFTPPKLSTQKEVEDLLSSIKSKTKLYGERFEVKETPVNKKATFNDMLLHEASSSQPFLGSHYDNITWVEHTHVPNEEPVEGEADYRGQIDTGNVDLDGDEKDETIKVIWDPGVSDNSLTIELYRDDVLFSTLKSSYGIQPNFKVEDTDGDGKLEIIIWSGLWDFRMAGGDGITEETYEGHSGLHRYVVATYKLMRGKYWLWDIYTTDKKYEPYCEEQPR